MGRKRWWLAAASLVLVGLVLPSLAGAGEPAFEKDEFGHLSGQLSHLLAAAGGGGLGGGSLPNQTCTSSGNPAANIMLNCDNLISPDNETPIITDPANPDHLLAGSNDYFITLIGATIQARVPTSFDGGLTWRQPVTVAVGHASISPSANGVFLDKEWLVADNYPSSPHYGRLYLSWDRLEFSKGAFLRSPVVLSYSDDAGKTWTRPREISGSNPTYCTANQGSAGPAGACDESFFSYPAVLPNGDVVVGFMNQQHSAAWESANEFEDQIMVVRSTDGGVHWSAPVHVVDLEDGGIEGIKFTDYPANVDGRATQTGFQFRTGSWGNLNVDPVTGKVYVVWTDNRDGTRDVAPPVTKTNVFVSLSSNEGATWSAPIRVTSGADDRWFPWIAARGGKVGIAYQQAAGTGLYVTRLATSTNGGVSWSSQTVSNAVSDADHSVWFRAHAPGCDTCATFIGDYIGLAYDTLGRAHITWTDMRRDLSIPAIGRSGKIQDDMYARR